MTDFQQFKIGGVQYPISSATTSPLLKDADPALYYAIDFFGSMITTLVGARLVAECSMRASGLNITNAVAYVLSQEPSRHLQQEQVKFPLLAVYRKNGVVRQRTSTWAERRCEFEVAYVLPPLTAGQSEALLPILHTIGDIFVVAGDQGFYPGYAPPGGNAGDVVWKVAGVEEVGFTKDSYGSYPGMGDLQFPAYIATFYATERVSDPVSFFGPWTAGDFQGDLLSGDGELFAALVQTQTDVVVPEGTAPTLASVSPITGSTAGYAITLTGNNFWPGSLTTVTVDGVLCPQGGVTVTSGTTITATTAAHAATASRVSVVVQRPDGRIATLSAALSFA